MIENHRVLNYGLRRISVTTGSRGVFVAREQKSRASEMRLNQCLRFAPQGINWMGRLQLI